MNPHDPDPLTSEEYGNAYLDGWAHGFSDSPRVLTRTMPSYGPVWMLVGFVLGIAFAAVVFALTSHVSATSRSEPAPSIPVAAQARTEASRGGVVERDGESRGGGWDDGLQAAPRPAPVGSNPTVDASLSGTASWYPARGLIAAAGPGLRTGHWRGRSIVVSANGRSVTVTLADWCACPRRLVDLSDDAFARLAPLSRGLVHVSVSSAGPAPTPPMTDSVP